MKFRNRVTEMLGVELPIVQAPMGWIARSQLASQVAGRIDEIKPVAQILEETEKEFFETLQELRAQYL